MHVTVILKDILQISNTYHNDNDSKLLITTKINHCVIKNLSLELFFPNIVGIYLQQMTLDLLIL